MKKLSSSKSRRLLLFFHWNMKRPIHLCLAYLLLYRIVVKTITRAECRFLSWHTNSMLVTGIKVLSAVITAVNWRCVFEETCPWTLKVWLAEIPFRQRFSCAIKWSLSNERQTALITSEAWHLLIRLDFVMHCWCWIES